ncbi:MAG TPA: TIGR00282 family metallophosphoesterase [Spirochaetia bacterium]|nr:TIGR00282 family metallophosphoesterase [Spirochaetia bacterium]
MKILFVGEIVGKAGVFCLKTGLSALKAERGIDFVIANGEGTTGGFGLGKNHSIYMHKLGVNVITGGEKIYYKKDLVPFLPKAGFILRPANYPPGNPGRGYRIYQVGEKKVGLIVLLGQSGFNRVHLSNPFSYLPEIVAKLRQETNIIIVDFHAATTAEKYTMFYHADGKVSAVIGTHAKAITSDATILPGGTGVICDTGRTGSLVSVGGLEPTTEISKYLTGIPERSKEIGLTLEIQGAVIDIDDDGKATSIEAIRYPIKGEYHEGNGNNHFDEGENSNGDEEG